jgi:hypothetical protein
VGAATLVVANLGNRLLPDPWGMLVLPWLSSSPPPPLIDGAAVGTDGVGGGDGAQKLFVSEYAVHLGLGAVVVLVACGSIWMLLARRRGWSSPKPGRWVRGFGKLVGWMLLLAVFRWVALSKSDTVRPDYFKLRMVCPFFLYLTSPVCTNRGRQ